MSRPILIPPTVLHAENTRRVPSFCLPSPSLLPSGISSSISTLPGPSQRTPSEVMHQRRQSAPQNEPVVPQQIRSLMQEPTRSSQTSSPRGFGLNSGALSVQHPPPYCCGLVPKPFPHFGRIVLPNFGSASGGRLSATLLVVQTSRLGMTS